jgi:UDP-GlcNAc:undecaprenyl-phosphate GlcNAc-1-phosphate transferase
MKYFIVVVLLFFIELLYFKFAQRFRIVDKPNERSSHTGEVVRGGGVIFALSVLCFEVYFGFPHPYFLSGLILISFISFVDDIYSLPNRVRLMVHFLAIGLMFFDTTLIYAPFYWVLLFAVLFTGFINAFNFMDGINGITGVYGLVTIVSLGVINEIYVPFINTDLIIFLAIGIVIFNYFNFRVKARSFAGDVGSISLPLIISFLMIKLYIQCNSPIILLLLTIYGVDSVNTILKRVLRKENIFMPHRSHLYQILVHNRGMGHLQVSVLYGMLQLAINFIVLMFLFQDLSKQWLLIISILSLLSATYWLLIRKYSKNSI